MAGKKIGEGMKISEVMEKYPEAAKVMIAHRLHCIGCIAASGESIGQGAKAHGMKEEEIEEMVEEMNAAVEEKGARETKEDAEEKA